MPKDLKTSRPRLRVAALSLAGAVLGILGVLAPVQAQAATGAAAPVGAKDTGQRSFGVQPAGPKKPDPRANFTYRNVKPGQVFYDHVAFINISDKPVRLSVYAADGYNTSAGAFDLKKQNERATDVGSWVRLKRKVADMPARSALVTPIRISIPRNAEPGDHAGGIVASLKTLAKDAKGNSVSVDQRVGSRIYIRVSGALRPHLRLEQSHGVYHSKNPFTFGDADLTYTIRNDGNVRLIGNQSIRISNLFGGSKQAVKVPDMPELLPGYSFTFTTKVPKILPAFLMTGNVTIDPVSVSGNVDPATSQLSGSSRFWAVFWPLAALLLLAVGEVGRRRWLRRRRRGKATGGGTPGAEPGTGGPPGTGSAPERVPAALFVAGTVVSGMALLLGAAPAQAVPVAAAKVTKDLTFVPGKGLDISPMYGVTSGPCPKAATNVIGFLSGKGFPGKGTVVMTNSDTSISYTQAFGVPFGDTLQGFAQAAGVKLEGPYKITVKCIDESALKVYREFVGTVTFKKGKKFTAPTPKTPPNEGVPTSFLAQVFPQFKSGAGPAASPSAAASGAPATAADPAIATTGADTDQGSKILPFFLVIAGFAALGGTAYLGTRKPAGSGPAGTAPIAPAVEWPDDDETPATSKVPGREPDRKDTDAVPAISGGSNASAEENK